MRSNPGAAGTKECSFEGCTKPSKVTGLCDGHYSQSRRGIELRPLNSTRVSKYEGVTCKGSECDRQAESMGFCLSHYWQERTYGQTWPIIEGRRNKMQTVTANSTFSTERFCPHCNQTKHWKNFHLEQNMCVECYRVSLSKEIDLGYGKPSPKKKYTMDDMLADIARYAGSEQS